MQTPELNPSGYANSSVLTRTQGFTKLKYLLAHGTGESPHAPSFLFSSSSTSTVHYAADDNVHLQNAAELSKVLVQADIDFVQMYYTNCMRVSSSLCPSSLHFT